ncbi:MULTISPECIES: type II toxin-antitoxin system VapC family toxin [Pseudomonadota]|uniref:type II toxin-antitoxin system VapC family toxin n=1 Tax=Pseudomonadota TaxID=1224 RepID=UPI00076A7C8A|nr:MULTISPECIES: type II toxin-antitoxin system VapC family toxin [Pseudomonadota]MAF61957.1 PIN domain nuclease [Blastomonas sp.]
MIAVDTSALMAILLDEDSASACAECLASDQPLIMSAATLSEALIVAGGRNLGPEMAQMVSGLGIEIVAVTEDFAKRVAASYSRWGKGIHPASLNFGDCFAYQLAKDRECGLLYVGNDFAKTDIASAI